MLPFIVFFSLAILAGMRAAWVVKTDQVQGAFFLGLTLAFFLSLWIHILLEAFH